MRRKTERVRDTRAWQVVLRSELIRWDYSYVHLQSKNAIEKKDDSDYEKAQAGQRPAQVRPDGRRR